MITVTSDIDFSPWVLSCLDCLRQVILSGDPVHSTDLPAMRTRRQLLTVLADKDALLRATTIVEDDHLADHFPVRVAADRDRERSPGAELARLENVLVRHDVRHYSAASV